MLNSLNISDEYSVAMTGGDLTLLPEVSRAMIGGITLVPGMADVFTATDSEDRLIGYIICVLPGYLLFSTFAHFISGSWGPADARFTAKNHGLTATTVTRIIPCWILGLQSSSRKLSVSISGHFLGRANPISGSVVCQGATGSKSSCQRGPSEILPATLHTYLTLSVQLEITSYWVNLAMVRAEYQGQGVGAALFRLAFRRVCVANSLAHRPPI